MILKYKMSQNKILIQQIIVINPFAADTTAVIETADNMTVQVVLRKHIFRT